MSKIIKPPCNSHVVHINISKFVPEEITSIFVETSFGIGEAVSTPYKPRIYPIVLVEIVVDNEATQTVVPECLWAWGE